MRANVCVKHCCCVFSCFVVVVSATAIVLYLRDVLRIYVTVIFVRILYCVVYFFVVVVNKMLLEIDDKTRQINNTHTTHTAHVVNGGA